MFYGATITSDQCYTNKNLKSILGELRGALIPALKPQSNKKTNGYSGLIDQDCSNL